ncbi:MAG TPA: hypothetical protein PLO33_15025 [Kouleothrix sp.]|uniref:hypothetical protein n=1 Tax=Kouleothrix sp. TaxID=2779161 RepID=UPI002B8ADF9C|nr:hypothetical protein [Kouleothrix sp.]HRC76990.1 hypothetical protein [Kouleothrix sp.]
MSEEIALAIADRPLIAQQADEIDQLRERLAQAEADRAWLAKERATAEALMEGWQQRNHEAWVLVGELSYRLEYQIGQAKTLPAAKKFATALRKRIDARIGKEGR